MKEPYTGSENVSQNHTTEAVLNSIDNRCTVIRFLSIDRPAVLKKLPKRMICR